MFISIYVNKFVQINKMKIKHMIQQYYEWNLNETICLEKDISVQKLHIVSKLIYVPKKFPFINY